jgi:hypothetical protein
MNICTVLSNLGAWSKLQQQYSSEYLDIKQAIESILFDKGPFLYASKKGEPLPTFISESINRHQISVISNHLESYFINHGWSAEHLEEYRYASIPVIKEGIGVSWKFGKYPFIESDIFVNFPLAIQSGRCKIVVEIIPIKQLIHKLPRGTSSFETVKDRLSRFQPFPVKLPFLIIGIGEKQDEIVTSYEMTTELDQYLINTIGYTLVEMAFQTEKDSFDFKVELPESPKLSKEVCAFANHVNGGVILDGVNNSGEIFGIPESKIDSEKLRVIQVSQSNCQPSPKIDCEVFPVPDHSDKRLLVIHIHEYDRKPCMVDNKIYIRRGSSATPANPDEVREMILGRKMDNTKPDNTWLIA